MHLNQFKLDNFLSSAYHNAYPKYFLNQLKINFLLAQIKCHIKQQPARNFRVGGKSIFSALSVQFHYI